MVPAMTRPGNKSGGKQLSHGGIGHNPVDHHGKGRGNDRTNGRRSPGDAHGEVHIITVVLHGPDFDVSEPAGVRHGRARHAGEDDRADHIHMPQAPLHPTHQGQREIVDPGGDPAGVHQTASHDKERDGQEGEGVCAADHPVKNHEVRLNAFDNHVEEGGAGKRNRYGHADGHEQKKTADEGQGGHWCRPSFPTRVRTLEPLRQLPTAT